MQTAFSSGMAQQRPAFAGARVRAAGAVVVAARRAPRAVAVKPVAMGREQLPDLGRPAATATWDDVAKEESRKYRRTVRCGRRTPRIAPAKRRRRARQSSAPNPTHEPARAGPPDAACAGPRPAGRRARAGARAAPRRGRRGRRAAPAQPRARAAPYNAGAPPHPPPHPTPHASCPHTPRPPPPGVQL